MGTAREDFPNIFMWIDLDQWEKCLAGWGIWSRGQLPRLSSCRYTRKDRTFTFRDSEMMLVDKAAAEMSRRLGKHGLRALQMYYIADLPIAQLSKELRHGNQVTLRLLDLARRLTYNALVQFIAEDYPEEMALLDTQYFIGEEDVHTKSRGTVEHLKKRGRKRKV